jgi:hypothetical protein
VLFGYTHAIIKLPKNGLSSSVINYGCIGLAIEGVEKLASHTFQQRRRHRVQDI